MTNRRAANRLLRVASEGVKLMAASLVTIACPKCKQRHRISTLDAWNGRGLCYSCEPKLAGEVGKALSAATEE